MSCSMKTCVLFDGNMINSVYVGVVYRACLPSSSRDGHLITAMTSSWILLIVRLKIDDTSIVYL